MRTLATILMLVTLHWVLPTRAVAQWGRKPGGSLPPKSRPSASTNNTTVRGAQAIECNGWYYVPVRIVRPSEWSMADMDAICAEANRVWNKARIGFSFTVDNGRAGVMSQASFDLRMSGAAGLYTGNGRVQVDPDLQLLARGRVLAHELGHVLNLNNVGDRDRLMGPMADSLKSGIALTRSEIATARAAAKALTANK